MRSGHERLVVLIVEDDPLIRSDMVSEFNWRGWHVLEAGCGEEAVAAAHRGNHIDIVVTDIQLGGLVDGWQVAETLRGVWPDVPVIYTSGKPPDRARLVRGAVFFDKPCDPAQVADSSHKLCVSGTS
jgi:two-component system, OmpR family, response regulator